MNKSAWWAWAIKNSIVLICFTSLAIIFHKWWIALFAALFLSSIETETNKKQYYRVCDGCGKRSEYTDNYNDALDKAKIAGWTHIVDGDKDYCPECKNKF